MPNTPAQIRKGMAVWCAAPACTAAQRDRARAVLRALGDERQVSDEHFVAMATALSGTGPTYLFAVMEALVDAGVHLGFPRDLAHDLVAETLVGSSEYAAASNLHPAQLRNAVTSPGGTSAAAIYELEKGRLRTVLSDAVWAAYRRTVELGERLEAETLADGD
jgi:pyrroline-5-carboxylate reductase